MEKKSLSVLSQCDSYDTLLLLLLLLLSHLACDGCFPFKKAGLMKSSRPLGVRPSLDLEVLQLIKMWGGR